MTFKRTVTVSDGVARITISRGVVLIDEADLPKVEGVSLYFTYNDTSSYVIVRFKDLTTQRLGRFLLNPSAGMVVDHINGNPLDNRRKNLRVVTWQANNRNRVKQSGSNSSKYKGVCFYRSRFRATIYKDSKSHHLGFFADEAEAARAYDTAAREMFGRHAALNFPKVGEQSAHRPRTISYHAVGDSQ